MENYRSFLYLLVMGCALLIMAAIHSLSPKKTYAPPADVIGLKLYRPLFFGEKTKRKSSKIVKTQTVGNQEAIPDNAAKENKGTAESVKAISNSRKKKVPSEIPSTSIDKNLSVDDYFDEFLKDYKENVQSKRKYRNDVVVRYYKHLPDEEKAQILVDYGFYLHVRQVKDEARFKSQSSNIIFYGNEFPERDLKLITYLLVSNGIPIKRLQPFKDYDGWKRKSIEIGSSSKLASRQTLSLKQIKEFTVSN